MIELKSLLNIAIDGALEAGKKILSVYDSDDFDIEKKGDESPLTKADKLAHNVIVEFLSKTEIPILSEEGSTIPYETRKDWDYFWMVDPLDGTKEFIKKNGEFTVNIALIHKKRSVLGVVYCPVLNKLYYAIKGEGAFLIENGKKLTLTASQFTMSQKELKVVASRSHLNQDTQGFLDKLDNPQIISMGSSLKFLIVAEGKADLYPRYAPTMEWDTAAAQIIVEEAGGTVCQNGISDPVTYNKENLLNPYFLCSGFESL